MASLRKHDKRSPFWYACFRDTTGRQTNRSTKLTDRKKAQEYANELERVANGKLSVAQAQKVIADVYQRSTGVQIQCLTVRQHLDAWVANKAPQVSGSTSEKYRYCIGEFLRFLGARADQPLLHVSERDLIDFRDASAKEGRPKTTNNKLVTVASAFREAWLDGHIPDDIGKRLKRLKLRVQSERLKRDLFTQEQVDAIIASAKGEWQGITRFGAYTGQRLGDIVSLHWRDIQPTLICFVSRKTGRTMRVPIDPAVAEWLKAQPGKRQPNVPLFPKSYATFLKNKGKVSALSKQFRSLLAKLGYAAKNEYRAQGKGRKAVRAFSQLSFHSFRHYLTSQLHRAGVAAAIVRDIIGHDSEVVNRIYTDIDDQTKLEGLQKFASARALAAAAAAASSAANPAPQKEVTHAAA